MSIASIKSKVISFAQSASSNDNNVSKKFEIISSKGFKSSMPTILARDLKIEGSIVSSGLIEIEGNVKGNIKGNSVILREGGVFEGQIMAESLSIRGKFNGAIYAKSLDISSRAIVTGDIEYESLSVEDGACIDGQFKHVEAKKTA